MLLHKTSSKSPVTKRVHTKSVGILDFIVIIFVVVVTQIIIIRDIIAICVFCWLVYDAVYKPWSDITNNVKILQLQNTVIKLSNITQSAQYQDNEYQQKLL